MPQYATSASFNGSGLLPIISAVTTSIKPFWSIVLFAVWMSMNAAAYFAILKLTGRKRFFHTFTATSFIMFITSLLIASMNGINDILFLSGYWVAFYIMMTVLGWFMLDKYK
jgi:hypothetical protein